MSDDTLVFAVAVVLVLLLLFRLLLLLLIMLLLLFMSWQLSAIVVATMFSVVCHES